MNAKKTHAGGRGFGNSAAGSVRFRSTGQDDETSEVDYAEWSRGFHAAWDFLSPQLDRANSDADYWYAVANNPESFKARHRAALQTFAVLQNRKATAERLAELDRIAAERIAAERREVAR